jgi:hypothetical protein
LQVQLVSAGIGNISSGISLSLNVPYFVAASCTGSTGTTAVFVVVNLLTGQTKTATVGGLQNFAGTTTQTLGYDNFSTDYWLGNIAAVMVSGSFTPLTQLRSVAQRPWDFWHPVTLDNLIAIKPPAGGAVDLAGDISVIPVFAADTANLLAEVGDLSVTPTFAGETADLFALVGDLASSITLAADVAVSPALTGDIAPAITFSAGLTFFQNMGGDLSVTPVFSATPTGAVDLVGNLSPSTVLAAGIAKVGTAVSISLGSTGAAINPNLWGVNYSWNLVPQASFAAWNTMYETTIGVKSYTHPSGWNGENYLWPTNTMNAWNNWVPGTAVGEDVVSFAAAVSPGTVTSVLPMEDYILGNTNPATSAPWTLTDMVARIQAIFTGGFISGSVIGVILGNEFWNYAGANVPATRATYLQSYCTLAANVIPWIRTNYPSVKIYVTGQWLDQVGPTWVYSTDFVTLKNSISAISSAAWTAVDGIAIHNYAGTDTTLEHWAQIAPTVASIIADTGKTVISTEWAATKDRTDQSNGENYKFGIKNTQVMLLIADQMAKSGVQAASFWPDVFGSVNIAMADAAFSVVQFNGRLMNWMAGRITGTYLNVNNGGYPSLAAQNSASTATLIFAATQDGQLNVTLAMGSYASVTAATVMYHPTPNTNTNDYTALTSTLPVTVAGGNATFSLNIGGAGRGPGWEIAILTLQQPVTQDLAGNLSPSIALAGDTADLFAAVGDLAPSITLGADLTFRRDLAGDLSSSITLGAALTFPQPFVGDLAPSITLAADTANLLILVGDLAPSIAFAAETADLFALIGDLVPSIIFGTDLSGIPVFVGDLTPTTALAADITVVVSGTADLAADLAPSIVFGATSNLSVALVGDLAPSITFNGETAITWGLVGDLAPTVSLSSAFVLAAGSNFGMGGYGVGQYSRYTPGPIAFPAADLAPVVAFGGSLSINQFLAGDLAPSATFGGDFDINNQKQLSGNLSPSIVLGGNLTETIGLAGNLAPTVAFSATYDALQQLVSGLSPSVAFSATMISGPFWVTDPPPPSMWTPTSIQCPDVWTEVELCGDG